MSCKKKNPTNTLVTTSEGIIRKGNKQTKTNNDKIKVWTVENTEQMKLCRGRTLKILPE